MSGKIANAEELGLRLYIEGLLVPVISANVTVSVGTAASASIEIVAAESALRLLPRSMIHLFYLDAAAKEAGKSHSFHYKLLFAGELISTSYNKAGFGSRSIVLSCMDFTNLWDSHYLYMAQYTSGAQNDQNGIIGRRKTFYGAGAAGTFEFDDIQNNPHLFISYMASNREQCLTPSLKDSKKIMGGLFSVLELLGGVQGAFSGLNDWVTVEDRRVRLMDQMSSDSGDTAGALWAQEVFNEWLGGSLGESGALITFREIVNLVNRYIYYESVAIPNGQYIAGENGIPAWTVATVPAGGSTVTSDLRTPFKEHVEELVIRMNYYLDTYTWEHLCGLAGVAVANTGGEAATSTSISSTVRGTNPASMHSNGTAADMTAGGLKSSGYDSRTLAEVSGHGSYAADGGWYGAMHRFFLEARGGRKGDYKRMLKDIAQDLGLTVSETNAGGHNVLHMTHSSGGGGGGISLTEAFTLSAWNTITPDVLLQKLIEVVKIASLTSGMVWGDVHVEDINTWFAYKVFYWLKTEAIAEMMGRSGSLSDKGAYVYPSGTIPADRGLYEIYTGIGYGEEFGIYGVTATDYVWTGMGASPDPVHVQYSTGITGVNLTTELDGTGFGVAAVIPEGVETVSIDAERERLILHTFRPNIWFVPPPVCNIIFPEETASFAVSRAMLREVSRLQLDSYNSILQGSASNAILRNTWYAPEFESGESLQAAGIGSSNSIIYQHEKFSGIIPKYEKIPNIAHVAVPGVPAPAGTTPLSLSEAEEFGTEASEWNLLTYRFQARQASVTAKFLPRIVCGFPLLFIDHPGFVDSDSTEAPSQYLGMAQTVTHSVSQGGAQTTVMLSHVRSHKDGDLADDLFAQGKLKLQSRGGLRSATTGTNTLTTANVGMGDATVGYDTLYAWSLVKSFNDEGGTSPVRLSGSSVPPNPPAAGAGSNEVVLSGPDTEVRVILTYGAEPVRTSTGSGLTIVEVGTNAEIPLNDSASATSGTIGTWLKMSDLLLDCFSSAGVFGPADSVAIPGPTQTKILENNRLVDDGTAVNGPPIRIDKITARFSDHTVWDRGTNVVMFDRSVATPASPMRGGFVDWYQPVPGSMPISVTVEITEFYPFSSVEFIIEERTATPNPIETAIRPNWISDEYSNEHIGEYYTKIIGCNSIVDNYDSADGSKFPGKKAIVDAVDSIVSQYRAHTSGGSSATGWINSLSDRTTHATKAAVLGYTTYSGTEVPGFHSHAFGNKEDFDEMEDLKSIPMRGQRSTLSPELISTDLDPRRERRARVSEYLSTLQVRGDKLGKGLRG